MELLQATAAFIGTVIASFFIGAAASLGVLAVIALGINLLQRYLSNRYL